jgi:Uma2 family endonuclease
MTGGLQTRPEIQNLAQLLERLGGVSLERIRFQPAPGTAKVKDVLEIERREDRLYELVDGVLVEKGMGFLESRIAILLATALQQFVAEHDLGIVTGESGMIRMPANLVRIPDVAFIAWKKFPGRELPNQGAPRIVPDLAIEVLSKSNTKAEMARKLREYFDVGVRLVWFVDPQKRTVTVYRSATQSKTLSVDDRLDGGKVLPGFELPVKSLFANLGGKKRKRK